MQNYFYEYEASYHTVAWGRTVKGGELWWNVHAMYKNKINGNIRKETDIRKIREAVKEEKQKITPYFFSQNVAASEICGVIWRSPNARILYETHTDAIFYTGMHQCEATKGQTILVIASSEVKRQTVREGQGLEFLLSIERPILTYRTRVYMCSWYVSPS